MVFGFRGCGNLPVSLDLLIMSALTETRRSAGARGFWSGGFGREERDAGVTRVLRTPGEESPWQTGVGIMAQPLDTINSNWVVFDSVGEI